jgi:hypothetical protein
MPTVVQPFDNSSLGPGIHPPLASTEAEQEVYLKSSLFNGLFLFLLAYVLVYLPGQLSSVILASVVDKGPVLFHNKLLYMDVVGWDRFDAVSIYTSALFTNFLQFAIYFALYNRQKKDAIGFGKSLIFWLLMHSAVRSFGCVIPAVASDEGFKYIADWMYWGPYTLFLLSLLSITIMLILSGYLTRFALQSSASKNLIRASRRKRFISSAVLLPWIYGSLIITASQWPDWRESYHEISLLWSMGILILPMFFYLKFLNKKPVASVRNQHALNRNYASAGIATVLFLLFRLLLGNGVYF